MPLKNLSATVTHDKNKKCWYARLQYYNDAGKRVGVRRTAATKAEALEVLDALKAKHATGTLDSREKTFQALADELLESKYAPAAYSETGMKLSGVRSPSHASMMRKLTAFFGHLRLEQISVADLERYRSMRLATITKRGTPVKIATVNRELKLLRAMLNTAVRRRYLDRSPFDFVEPGTLISVAAEDSRNVIILKPEQEQRLLSACSTPRRRHLRALIITALDSGCRFGELRGLKWSDVNFAENFFTATSYKGKNKTTRPVPMTARVRDTFLQLREKPSLSSFRKDGMDQTLVFGIADNVKNGFNAACRDAGLHGLRFHDLRHNTATNLAASGMALPHISKVLGHLDQATSARYIDITPSVLDFAREVMEKRAAK